jgi:cytoskeleton protein RodZ
MIENEQEHQEAVTLGPGQILRQARELAKLSSQDIADKMKLKKSLVEDIERDNYDINISLTFVRGYLKLYAKHVNVDEVEILTAFESLSTQKKEPAKLQSFSRRIANQANDDKLMLVTYLVVAVVIALVVIWWFQQSSPDTAVTSNMSNYPETIVQDDAVQQTTGQEELAPEETALVDTTASIPTSTDENALLISNSEVTTSDIQRPEDFEEQTIDNQAIETSVVDETNNVEDFIQTTAPDNATPVELIFEFSGDCWMNLADATGENIAYGVKVKGRVMPVTGIPPFVVTLGAPEVVNIRYAGEAIDMSFLPAGRIAKFDLPLSE